MRRLTRVLTLIVAVGAVGLLACDDDQPTGPAPSVDQVIVSPETATLNVGGSIQFVAQVQTTGDAAQTVNWSSSNTNVVTVDQNGVATAQSAGTASIIATSTENSNKSDAASVTVRSVEEAEVTISGWKAVSRFFAGGDVNNPDAVGTGTGHGNERLVVTMNVDEGGQDVSEVQLTLNGEVVASQTFSDENVQPQSGGSSTVELAVNTDAFEGMENGRPANPDGEAETPLYPNGTYTLGARGQLAGGGTVTSSTIDLQFNNLDRFYVSHLSGGQGLTQVGGGPTYWGGEDMTFGVDIVPYSGATYGSVSVRTNRGNATANGGATMDINADGTANNPGTPGTASGPYTYTAVAAEQGAVEDIAGADDGFGGEGHDLTVASVTNEQGQSVGLSNLDLRNLFDFFVDYRAPNVNDGAASELLIGGNDPDGSKWYEEGLAFSVSNTSELGVGIGDAGATFSADDANTSASPDLEDVSSTDDLTELTLADWTIKLTNFADALGNAVDLTANPVDTDGDANDPNGSEGFGLDKNGIEYSGLAPTADNPWLNPDDDAGDGTSDNNLQFTAMDPALATGAAGSGYNTSTLSFTQPDGTTGMMNSAISPNASGANEIDLDASGGINTPAMDGQWEVVVTTTDNTVTGLAGNPVTQTFTFRSDASDPTTNLTDPPSSSVTSSNSTLTFPIDGNAMDGQSGLSSVTVTVRREDDTAGAGGCDLNDPLLTVGSGPGEVNQNSIDVTDSADGFTVDFVIQNAGSGTTQEVCFFIESEDSAMDVNGNLEPNTSNQSANTVIDWQ